MPDILFGWVIPATITGGLCTLAVMALRLFGSRLLGSVHKTAIVSAAVVYLLPLGLLFGLVRNISIPQQPPAQQNAAALTQQQESESTIGTLLEELPVTAPTYNAGKQIGDLITVADTSAGTLSNYSENGDSGFGNNAVANDMAGKPEAAVPGARELLVLIYAAGVVIYALVVTFRYMVFQRRLRKTSYEINTEWKLKEAQKLAAELGIKHMPLLLRNNAVSAPMITGIFKPVLVLPGALADKRGFSLSVRHELIHYKHKDLIIKMLLLILSVVHWFNPLVHLLRYSYARCCEAHCDETVACRLNSKERRIYAETLLQFASQHVPYAATGIATPKNKLKERLKMVINPKKRRWYITLLCAVLFVTATSFGLLVGCGITADKNAEEPELRRIEITNFDELLAALKDEYDIVEVTDRYEILINADIIIEHDVTLICKSAYSKLELAAGSTFTVEEGVTVTLETLDFIVNGQIVNEGSIVVESGGKVTFYAESTEIGDIKPAKTDIPAPYNLFNCGQIVLSDKNINEAVLNSNLSKESLYTAIVIPEEFEFTEEIVVSRTIVLSGNYIRFGQGQKLVVKAGATLMVEIPNFVIYGAQIENDGTILVIPGGRMIFDTEPSKTGDIRAVGASSSAKYVSDCFVHGQVLRSPGWVSFEELAGYFSDDSIYTAVALNIGRSDNSLIDIIIERNFTIPEGKTLELNGNCVLNVPQGVTLTVDGYITTYHDPTGGGTINGRSNIIRY